jgi:hypothetical protein
MSIEEIKKTTARPELVEGLNRLKSLFTFKQPLLTKDS